MKVIVVQFWEPLKFELKSLKIVCHQQEKKLSCKTLFDFGASLTN